MDIYTCKVCGQQNDNLRDLLKHITKNHRRSKHNSITSTEYYERYIKPTTSCKYCGGEIPFSMRFEECCSIDHRKNYKLLESGKLKIVCEICGVGFPEVKNLAKHLTEVHKETSLEEYYNKYLKKDEDPDGNCLWCGEKLSFKSLSQGYNKFCHNKDCNVRWYNENTDRLKQAGKGIKKSRENGDNIPTQLGYWIKKGYSEDDAKKKLKERQTTFSKEKCIKKYGKEKGIEKWKKRQDKWLKTLDSKSDEEKIVMNRKKAFSAGSISNVEKEICKITKCDSQYVINGGKYYIYDMVKGNKIIEYNGDYWHCNPNKYKGNYYNSQLGMSAKEKWKADKEKIDYAKSKGFDVLVIWETDYKKDKEKVIKKCMEFLND